MTIPAGNPSPNQVMLMNWVIWFGLVTGLILILGVLAFVREPPENPDAGPTLFTYLAAGITALVMSTGVVMRKVMFGSERPVPTGKFRTGNIMMWAMCEGPATMSIILWFIDETHWTLAPGLVAMAVLVMAYPRSSYLRHDELSPYAPREIR